MADLLRNGAAWLADVMSSHVSQTVTYRRGSSIAVSVPATFRNSADEAFSEFGGARLRTDGRAFDINADDLVNNGAAITPQTGDLIDVVEGGVTCRYRVAPASADVPEFAWDDYRLTMTVQTKFLKQL